jgi:hypothetical protein
MAIEPTLPPNLAAELADLKRRIANLERSPSLPFSSTRGGTFIFLDNNGKVRRAQGNVTFDGSIGGATDGYGDYQYGDDGAVIAAAQEGDKGVVYPQEPYPFHVPASITVTSGSFQTLWENYQDWPAYEVLYVEFACITDVGTTGEIRLFENKRNIASSVASLPSGFNGLAYFEWLHPATVGLFDPHGGDPLAVNNLNVAVQARRASGAGNVIVYPPRNQLLTSKFLHPNAATNGNPTIVFP